MQTSIRRHPALAGAPKWGIRSPFTSKTRNLKNDYGDMVEEFEIQFIDGETIDGALFKALSVHQGNVLSFIEQIEKWDDHEKTVLIIAIGECSYEFDMESGSPYDFEVDLYEIDSLRELAYQFVEDGLFGDIPASIAGYLDYDAIARDLGCDYSETCIAGRSYVYRCG